MSGGGGVVVPDLGADPTGVFRGTTGVKKKKKTKKQMDNDTAVRDELTSAQLWW